MREILFRGKRTDNKQWVEGYYALIGEENPNAYIIKNNGHRVRVAHKSVSEFSGLCDKNGKKIFEGDICRFREWSKGDMCWIGKVHYEHQQFVISGEKNKECESPFLLVMSRFIPENIEVIGNIHDNG